MKLCLVFALIWAKLWKKCLLKMLNNSSKNPDPDQEANIFQNVIHLWDPDGRLSPREWELSWPIAVVEPEVAVDDKWAVPRDLLACPLLLRARYRHRIQNLTSVRPVRPITGKEGWMGQMTDMADSVKAWGSSPCGGVEAAESATCPERNSILH